MKNRHDVPVESLWDLTLLFETEELFEQTLAKTTIAIQDFSDKYDGKINKPETVNEALAEYRQIMESVVQLFSYASLDVETNVFNKEAHPMVPCCMNHWKGILYRERMFLSVIQQFIHMIHGQS